MKQVKGFNPNHGRSERYAGLKVGTAGRYKTGQYTTEPGASGFKRVIRQYKIGAGQRGIPFMLSDSDVRRLTKSNCYYCNAVPSNIAFCEKQRTAESYERSKYVYNGIDRVDNTKPYILENCVPCCRTCNRAKNNQSLQEFMSYLNDLVVNFGGVPFLT